MLDIKFCKHVKKQHLSSFIRGARECVIEHDKKVEDERQRKVEAQLAAKLAAITIPLL